MTATLAISWPMLNKNPLTARPMPTNKWAPMKMFLWANLVEIIGAKVAPTRPAATKI